MAVKAFTNEGDSVIIQQPVYYPFKETIEDNNRVVVNNSLKNVNGHYEIDFEDFERKVKENNVKLFILCSPHNPVGRVWKKWELEKLGDICVENNVTVVSDEIHSDFVYPGNKHTAFANIKEEFQNIISYMILHQARLSTWQDFRFRTLLFQMINLERSLENK